MAEYNDWQERKADNIEGEYEQHKKELDAKIRAIAENWTATLNLSGAGVMEKRNGTLFIRPFDVDEVETILDSCFFDEAQRLLKSQRDYELRQV
jgi:hypothetical protein